MGKLTVVIADHTGETSRVTVPMSDLTAANIDAELAEVLAFRNAMNDIQRGLELEYSIEAVRSPQAVGRSNDAEAQREEKALVRYYDTVTFKRATMEIPCVDMSTQHPDYPGVFLKAGAANNPALWSAFVAAFVTMVPGPSGNFSSIEEIIHVGRNT